MFVVKDEIDCNGYASLIYVFLSEKGTCSWSSSLLCSRWITTRFMFNTKWKSLTKDCAVEKHIYFEKEDANVRKFKSLHARDKVRQRWGDGKTTSQFEVGRKRKNGEMWKPRRIESFYWDLAAYIYNDTKWVVWGKSWVARDIMLNLGHTEHRGCNAVLAYVCVVKSSKQITVHLS